MDGGLKISRKAGETIKIGDDVEIRVEELGGGRVNLIICAPKGVPILRGELLEREPEARTTARKLQDDAPSGAGCRGASRIRRTPANLPA